MKLTADNYESWLLRFGEEPATPEMLEEVEEFLLHNPELVAELEGIEPVSGGSAQDGFVGKEFLKRDPLTELSHLDLLAIATLEGDLGPHDAEGLITLLQHDPAKEAYFRSFSAVKLVAPLEITYPGKEQLKRGNVVMLAVWRSLAAVAAVFLLALLVYFYDYGKQPKAISALAISQQPEVKISKPVKPSGDLSVVKYDPSPNPLVKIKSVAVAKSTVAGKEEPTDRSVQSATLLQPRNGGNLLIASVPAVLAPLKIREASHASVSDLPLTDYLKSIMQLLKRLNKSNILTREEVTVAGLHLFARLPGKHLTGKSDKEGHLRSISFNTQLLAFSIPVNR